MLLPPTKRFSSRVQNYVKYRPSYPLEVRQLLENQCRLSATSVVADIGSGTGISTELFLEGGASVYAVEPNDDMREAAEVRLAGRPGFTSVSGTAEATTLPDTSVDFVVAGQAFHWFDGPKARAEFVRVLRPGGWVALMWNERVGGTPFVDRYEKLIAQYAPEYGETTHTRFDEQSLAAFFAPVEMQIHRFPNSQRFDLEGLKGRLMSSSYSPEEGHPNHEPMLAELERIFSETNDDGMVELLYETEVYLGQLV